MNSSHLLTIEPNLGHPTNEPNLLELIEHYYASHGCSDWKELAAQYFDKWAQSVNQLEDNQ